MHKNKILILLMISVLLCGCHSLLSNIHVYSLQQGNTITSEDVKQLHIGMSQEEVQALLGDPILLNTFRPNRWDYIYTFEKPHHALIERKLILYFSNDDRLLKIQQ